VKHRGQHIVVAMLCCLLAFAASASASARGCSTGIDKIVVA
jgi:hypothetical protein